MKLNLKVSVIKFPLLFFSRHDGYVADNWLAQLWSYCYQKLQWSPIWVGRLPSTHYGWHNFARKSRGTSNLENSEAKLWKRSSPSTTHGRSLHLRYQQI
jgi:hypothetical protein